MLLLSAQHLMRVWAKSVVFVLVLCSCGPPSGSATIQERKQPPRPLPEPKPEPVSVSPKLAEAASPEPEPLPAACEPLSKLDVLFVGNSYMLLGDTPGYFAEMGKAVGLPMHVDRAAVGGKNFDFHVERRKTHDAISSRSWDVVVLQSHSLDPLRNLEGFKRSGAALIEEVQAQGAQAYLFETWARREGHNLYNYFKPTGGSPAAMLAAVSAEYKELGQAMNAEVVPVGTAWAELLRTSPELKPHLKDGAHPSELGAYLSAAVVFAALTQRAAGGRIGALREVDAKTAVQLHAVAAKVVEPPCTW